MMVMIKANFVCSGRGLALDTDNLHSSRGIPTEVAGAGGDIGTGRNLVLMLLWKKRRMQN